MRFLWNICIVLILATGANAQITKTATFDNYTAGQGFNPSFTDPLSGITFSNSTNPSGGFAIDSDPLNIFNGNNYLTAGGGGGDGFGAYFGFTATMSEPANNVSVDVYFQGIPSQIVLSGFNSAVTVVSQESGLPTSPDPFTLEIDSSQYNITSFQITGTRSGGFDNVSYTYLPEPNTLAVISGIVAFGFRRGSR